MGRDPGRGRSIDMTPFQTMNMERPDSSYPDYDPLYGEDPYDYSEEYWEDLRLYREEGEY